MICRFHEQSSLITIWHVKPNILVWYMEKFISIFSINTDKLLLRTQFWLIALSYIQIVVSCENADHSLFSDDLCVIAGGASFGEKKWGLNISTKRYQWQRYNSGFIRKSNYSSREWQFWLSCISRKTFHDKEWHNIHWKRRTGEKCQFVSFENVWA